MLLVHEKISIYNFAIKILISFLDKSRHGTSSDHSVSFLRYNILVISERSSKITSGFTSLVFTSSLVLSPLSTKIDVTSL